MLSKLLFILLAAGALVDEMTRSEPPLLIDSSPAAPVQQVVLDAAE